MKQERIKIAITGGIGSGKSTVAKIIGEQGFNTVSCDAVYRELLAENRFKAKLIEEFGDIFNPDGSLDKSKLSMLVFSDKAKLKKLNDITHPEIMKAALKKMDCAGLNFCEVPLLFENGFEKLFDKVLVVLRGKEQRAEAVSRRDLIDKNSVNLRINSQFDYDNTDFAEYYVIHNDSDLKNLRDETLKILSELKKIFI